MLSDNAASTSLKTLKCRAESARAVHCVFTASAKALSIAASKDSLIAAETPATSRGSTNSNDADVTCDISSRKAQCEAALVSNTMKLAPDRGQPRSSISGAKTIDAYCLGVRSTWEYKAPPLPTTMFEQPLSSTPLKRIG